ncbi:MAG: DUF3995 domain-containing protein [Hyphomonadaceae bacterium]
MSVIGGALIVVLSALAALHLYWGLGGFWPGTDARSLSQRVAGTNGGTASRLGPCAMVTTALVAAAAIVFLGQGDVSDLVHALIIYGGYATLILVFGLRGLAAYLTPVFNYARETPFFTLNRRYYAPLCLVLAAGLIADFPPGLLH